MKNHKAPNSRLKVLIGSTNTMSIIDEKGRYTIARLRGEQSEVTYKISGIESQTGERWSILLDKDLNIAQRNISKTTQEKVHNILTTIGIPRKCIQEDPYEEDEEYLTGWVVDAN